MRPLVPRPTMIVDAWAFRLADPDGNLIGRQESIVIKDASGVITSLLPMPGIERLVSALPLDE